MHSYVCKQTCSNLQWQTIRRCRTDGTITCHIVVCVCNCFLCVTKWVRERMRVGWVLNKSQLIALYAWMHWLLTLSLYNFVNVWRDSQTNGVNLIESKTLFNTHFKQLCVCALMLLTFLSLGVGSVGRYLFVCTVTEILLVRVENKIHIWVRWGRARVLQMWICLVERVDIRNNFLSRTITILLK